MIDSLLVHGASLEKLAYELLLVRVELHLLAVMRLVKRRRNIQRCLLLSLRIDVDALLIDQVAHHLRAQAKACCVERPVRRRVLEACTLSCQILHYR